MREGERTVTSWFPLLEDLEWYWGLKHDHLAQSQDQIPIMDQSNSRFLSNLYMFLTPTNSESENLAHFRNPK